MITGRDGSTGLRAIGRELVPLAATLAFMGGLSWVLWERMTEPNLRPGHTRIGNVVMASASFEERCGAAELALVDVIHGEDGASWIEEGTAIFMEDCPNVQVRSYEMSDAEAMAAIESGTLVPALWVPSSSMLADHLEERWGSERPAIERGGSLLRSPLVLLLWEDRARALDVLAPELADDPSVWARLACAGVPPRRVGPVVDDEPAQPRTWIEWWSGAFPSPRQMPEQPAPSTLERWGEVRVEHAMPSRSSDGTLVLLLLAHSYAAAELGEEALADVEALEDALDARQEALEDWLRRCEGDRHELVETAEALTERMFQLDAQGHDGVVTTERLALEVLARIGRHEEGLSRARVVYPRSTIVQDHPAVWFAVDDESAREGAERLVAYLQGPRMQRSAIRLGFRPGDSSVSIHDDGLRPNPFLELRRFGARLGLDLHELPPVSRERLRRLVDAWRSATGRH